MKVNIGDKIGMLSIIAPVPIPPESKDRHKRYLCKCDCGKETVISSGNIGRGTFSCGCKKKMSIPKTRGFASHKLYDKLYHTWLGIKYRCNNPKSKDFPHYGARGIRMCEEWTNDFMVFRTWAIANGYAEELTIDRINVNGNYEPSNCRWVTVAEQNRNKTTTKGKAS